MATWAPAPQTREQTLLFCPSLEAMIPEDHPVRLFEELLAQLDWSAWEAAYTPGVGRPAYHPRVVAGVILYGLRLGLRSSRQLEDACVNRLDFLWLVEGRRLDHATFALFRTRFEKPLSDLFAQVCRLAVRLGALSLCTAAVDGTRVEASAGRHTTADAEALARQVAAAEEQFAADLAAWAAADAAERGEPNRLPPPLARRAARLARLQAALAEAEAGRRVAPADPEARVMPGKKGGHAPSYTPLVAVDPASKLALAAEVSGEASEAGCLLGLVAQVVENLGEGPQQVLADGAYGTEHNLVGAEAAKFELLAPPPQGEAADTAWLRRDPGEAVAPEDWERLPRTGSGQLDRQAFGYDEEADCYWCPLGHPLPYHHKKKGERAEGQVVYRVYRCAHCGECPLRSQCLAPTAQARTVQRSEREALRAEAAARYRSPEGQAAYVKRRQVEGVFGQIKAVMGVRQFLLRGQQKVRTEWRWVCCAYNLGVLGRWLANGGAGGEPRGAAGAGSGRPAWIRRCGRRIHVIQPRCPARLAA